MHEGSAAVAPVRVEVVRDHLRNLTATGLSLARIATMVGVPAPTLSGYLTRSDVHIPDQAHAAAILALDITDAQAIIDARDAQTKRVQAHLQSLIDADIPVAQLATQLQLSKPTLFKYLGGKITTPRPEVAERILSYHLDVALEETDPLIDAAPTIRRIQALVAAGYSRHTIADLIGVHSERLSQLPQQQRVFRSLADRIEAAYHRLAYRTPTYRGALHRSRGTRVATQARAEGWLTAVDWIDIEAGIADSDDGTFDEDYIDVVAVEGVLRGERHRLTTAERLSVLDTLDERGATANRAMELLGMNRASYQKLLAIRDARREASPEAIAA